MSWVEGGGATGTRVRARDGPDIDKDNKHKRFLQPAPPVPTNGCMGIVTVTMQTVDLWNWVQLVT